MMRINAKIIQIQDFHIRMLFERIRINIRMLQKLVQYIKDSKSELKKVAWPTRKQTINHTLLVIGFSIAMAIFLGVIDFGLSKVIETIVK